MPNEKLPEMVEEIKGLVHEVQAKSEEVSKGKADKEVVDRMSEKFAELSEAVQKSNIEIEAEKKARESLELVMSKISSGNGGDGEIKSAPEYVAEFDHYLRTRQGLKSETVDAEFKNLMDAMAPGMDDQSVHVSE